MSSAALQQIIFEHFEKDGTMDRIMERGEEKKARDTAIEMLKDGFTPDKVARYVKMPIEWVQSLTR